jgi:hypothetical protein
MCVNTDVLFAENMDLSRIKSAADGIEYEQHILRGHSAGDKLSAGVTGLTQENLTPSLSDAAEQINKRLGDVATSCPASAHVVEGGAVALIQELG